MSCGLVSKVLLFRGILMLLHPYNKNGKILSIQMTLNE